MRKLILALVLTLPLQAADIHLEWNDNSDNEEGFVVERSTDGTTFVQVGTTSVNVNNYVDVGVPLNVELTYRVYAFNDYGDSTYSNTVMEKTFPPQGPDGLRKKKNNPVAWMTRYLIGLFNNRKRT